MQLIKSDIHIEMECLVIYFSVHEDTLVRPPMLK